MDILETRDHQDLEALLVSPVHLDYRVIVDLLDQVDLLEKEETGVSQDMQVALGLQVHQDQRAHLVLPGERENEAQVELRATRAGLDIRDLLELLETPETWEFQALRDHQVQMEHGVKTANVVIQVLQDKMDLLEHQD